MMIKNALILHDINYGTQKSFLPRRLRSWLPWLKRQLEKLNYHVWLPDLPAPERLDLENCWFFLKNFDFNSQTVIVGHGAGGALTFGVLHKLLPGEKVKLAISVAGFYQDRGWNCQGLFPQPYNWQKIKRQAKKIILISADNDPYISWTQTEFLARYLSIKPIIFYGQGHFDLEGHPKYQQFPELLSLIKKF